MVNAMTGFREMYAQSSDAIRRAIDRGNRHKKEGAVQAQNLARLHKESKAQEEDLRKQVEEGKKEAMAAAARISSLEAELDRTLIKLKTLHARSEEQDGHLHQMQRQALAARDEARAAAEKVAAAEKAAAEAALEKAGAVAFADEAGARAGEAENRAWEAEARAKEAESKAQDAEARASEAEAKARQAETDKEKALGEYKSSPEYRKDITEASLDAYLKGFDSCKAQVSSVFKIGGAELEKIQPEESDEEQAGEEGGEEADTSKP